MSRASAYRLRDREDAMGFAHAWDMVLTPPGCGRHSAPKPDWRKVTTEALVKRLETGLVRPVLYRGQMTGIARKLDNSALFQLLRREDALAVTAARTQTRRSARSFSKPPGVWSI